MTLSPARATALRVFRYAMFFDGVDDLVEVPHSSSISLTQAATVIAWVWRQSMYEDLLVVKGSIGRRSYRLFLYARNIGYPRFEIFTTDNIAYYATWFVPLPIGMWHFLAGTFDGRYVKIYVNAELKDIIDIGNEVLMRENTEPLFIGRANGVSFYGYISEVLIYSRALAESEILWNYKYPWNPVRNGLVLMLYTHPDYVKDIDGDGVQEWIDLSGYNNHGKIYGATLVEVAKTPTR